MVAVRTIRTVGGRCGQLDLSGRRGAGSLVREDGRVVFRGRFLNHGCGIFQRDRGHAELASGLFDFGLGAPALEAGRDRTDAFFGILGPLHGDVIVGQIGFERSFGVRGCFENRLVDQFEAIATGGADGALHGRLALADVAAAVADEVILVSSDPGRLESLR